MTEADGPAAAIAKPVGAVASWFRRALASAPAIYGLIVYEALIAGTSDHVVDWRAQINGATISSTWLLVIASVLVLGVFYLAHGFAHAIADRSPDSLRHATRHGFAHSLGMLYAAILPTAAIVIVALADGTPDDAASWALVVGLVVLAFLGYEAAAQRGRPIWARIVVGLVTAAIGFVIMLLYYVTK